MPALQVAFPQVSTHQLCPLLGISRSWWYEQQGRSDDDAESGALREAIEGIVLAFPGYGYRRVTHALRRQGWTVNAKRVLRLMREELLLCRSTRRTVRTTDSRHGRESVPNRLAGQVLSGPDQAWVADITYIRLPTSFCYLATLLDACSRRIVGWELSSRLDTNLVLAALERALEQRQPAPGWIHHSDQGSQYAAQRYRDRLAAAGAQVSMAAVGNVYENALAESFFATLKREEVSLHEYHSLAEAKARLEHFIEEVYNHQRLHSRLGYRPPSEFEAAVHDDDDFLEDLRTPTLSAVR
jgi:putative transposase